MSDPNRVRAGPTRKDLEVEHLRDALEGMVRQFGHYVSGAYITGGLSALEDAFAALGWEERHPAPEDACAEPDCGERATCGHPTAEGYRWTCGEHWKGPK